MAYGDFKFEAFVVAIIISIFLIVYSVPNLYDCLRVNELEKLLHAPKITLLPGNSLNFTFGSRTLIFIASDIPLKIEPSNVEVYFLDYKTNIGGYILKYTEIVAQPKMTVRIINNHTVPVSLVAHTMELPPGAEVVDGKLRVSSFGLLLCILLTIMLWMLARSTIIW